MLREFTLAPLPSPWQRLFRSDMKALFLTNEYPPHIYGGAGVHVDYLTQNLKDLIEVEVRCFGEQRIEEPNLTVTGYQASKEGMECPEQLRSLFATLRNCLDFNSAGIDADIVHCHTWYTHLGGILAQLNYGIPFVLTVHSLEPLRPWKREQLGRGYDCSSWVERTALERADAVIAVSEGTRDDILNLFDLPEEKVRIIYNGIDPAQYRPSCREATLVELGIDPAKPYLLFVGRIARQKGIIHLVNAIPHFDDDFQVVLCAGAPDTPEIAEEMTHAVEKARKKRPGIIWIDRMLEKAQTIDLYAGAAVFCCPSIYEPFGIINLEAMACETAVVASQVGGIPEVVVDGVTGFLVPLEQQEESPFEPVDPDQFSKDLAEHVNRLMADPELRVRFGEAGRERAVETFSWESIARQTVDLYQELIGRRSAKK